VRFGAEQRGGWAYQSIAVVLTYLAIAASYVPLVYESFVAQASAEAGQEAAAASSPEPPGEAPVDETLVLLLSIPVALALPVLQATEGTGILGLLIVGFALYEAWKINRRQTIAFTGPFRLQRSPAERPA